MREEKPITKNRWIWNVVLIILVLFLPGIRGYQIWRLDEYILYVFLPIAGLIYDIFKGKRKDKLSS